MKWKDLISDACRSALISHDHQLRTVVNRKVIARTNPDAIAPGDWLPETYEVISDEVTNGVRKISASNSAGNYKFGNAENFAVLIQATISEALVGKTGFYSSNGGTARPVLIVADNFSDRGSDAEPRMLKIKSFYGPDKGRLRFCEARNVLLIVPLPADDGYRRNSTFALGYAGRDNKNTLSLKPKPLDPA